MGLKYPSAKLTDDILSTIIKTSCFSLMEIGYCLSGWIVALMLY